MDHALNNREISYLLSRHPYTKKVFKGFLHPRDEERPVLRTPALYVVNTDYIDGPGIHWLLILYKKFETLFFDPFGFSPDVHAFPLVVEHANNAVTYNTFTVQDFSSRSYACGHFVVLYAILLSRGLSLKSIEKSYFTADTGVNDAIAIELTSWLFSVMSTL